jgi:CheY-like chemotaxis protein
MSEFNEMLKALAPLAWPLLVAILIWRLLPTVRSVIQSRGFALKFAGMEVSVQEATDQIKEQLQELSDQVVALRRASNNVVGEPPPPAAVEARRPMILWVDDKPETIALEMSQLQDQGFIVRSATSTREALSELKDRTFAAVISDLGRKEDGRTNARAGIDLLTEARRIGYAKPFFIYTGRRLTDRIETEVKGAGGDGITWSRITLLEWIDDRVARVT